MAGGDRSAAAEAATAARPLSGPPREAFLPVDVIGPPEAPVTAALPIEIGLPGGYAVRACRPDAMPLSWTSDFDVHGRTVNSARNRKFETDRLNIDQIR